MFSKNYMSLFINFYYRSTKILSFVFVSKMTIDGAGKYGGSENDGDIQKLAEARAKASRQGGTPLKAFHIGDLLSGRPRLKKRYKKKRKTRKCSKKRLSKKMICFKGPMKHLKKMKKYKTKKVRLTRCSKLRLKK